MKISARTNFPQVARAMRTLSKDVGERAMVSTLNKTVAKSKTAMSREITAEYRIASSEVKERLTIRKAFRKGEFKLEASLSGAGRTGRSRSMNLKPFVTTVNLKPGGGVKVKIRKSAAARQVTGAFIGNKGRTVFMRVGNERLPIEAKQTIDVPQMFNAKRINRVVIKQIEQDFPRIFASESAFYLRRFNGS